MIQELITCLFRATLATLVPFPPSHPGPGLTPIHLDSSLAGRLGIAGHSWGIAGQLLPWPSGPSSLVVGDPCKSSQILMDSVMIWWSELNLLAAHGKSRHSVAPTGVSRLEIMHHRPSTSGRRWCFLQSVAPLIGTSRDRHPMRFFGLQEMPSVSFSVLWKPEISRKAQPRARRSSTRAQSNSSWTRGMIQPTL